MKPLMRTSNYPTHSFSSARGATLIALGLLLAWLPEGAVAAENAVPDLSGVWELDGDLSEDPMQKMREQRRSGSFAGRGGGRGGGFGGGRPGGGPGGLGGGGRRGGGPGGAPDREEMQERMQAQRERVERLEITQASGQVAIVFGDGSEHGFTTDNQKNLVETPLGETEVTAKWKAGGLEVKTKAGERKTTETYHITRDGSLLTVLVEMDGQGPRGSVSFKRIYRPAEAGDQADSTAE